LLNLREVTRTTPLAMHSAHDHLVDRARRHLAEGEARVGAQKSLIAQLRRDRHDTKQAERLLAALTASVAVLRKLLLDAELRRMSDVVCEARHALAAREQQRERAHPCPAGAHVL
jgi:hypothetical protein